MVTLGELLLEFIKSLFDLKDKLRNANQDKTNRIAELFEHISAILATAADKFAEGENPIDICREISEYLNAYPLFIKDVYKDKDKAARLHNELLRALYADYRLISFNNKKQHLVDLITIRPYLTVLPYREFQELVGKKSFDVNQIGKTRGWEESGKLSDLEFIREKSPVLYLTDDELDNIIKSEIERLREASGLFRATAKMLRVGINA